MPQHRPARPALVPAAGAVTAAVLLALAAPDPVTALHRLQTGTAADPTAPLVAVLALVAQLLVVWLAVVVLLTLAAHLPGLPGRACALVARRVAPAAVRRAVEVSLGVAVTVGVMGAVPAAAATPGRAAATTAAAAVSALDGAAPAASGTLVDAAPVAPSSSDVPSSSDPRPSSPTDAAGTRLGTHVGSPVPDLDWPDVDRLRSSTATVDGGTSPSPGAALTPSHPGAPATGRGAGPTAPAPASQQGTGTARPTDQRPTRRLL